ncbi:chemotaxis protein CheW [Massilia sp. YIM B02763]|uniref:chemotaxis protein CheW n=1 Tax=Massilia sp. YIM B02763 TaxID=3050130 RepID=UPI0025B6E4C0|nr:chemotaxis protein CheW [Massilia sp. YIM B02763]MDN4054776.1 chemotaxis protein CheW [Massilia sp. YIM B02763]
MRANQDSLLDSFLPHMPDVGRYQAALRELHQTWRLIEASAKMNCPAEARMLLPAVVATRTNLGQLEEALVAKLVSEKVQQVLGEAATRAQYALDLLVRNLFERTADVGFLATDVDLCRFAAGLDDDHERAQARLAAYRDKYTVYDDILVLAPDGRVLVQADAGAHLAASDDPLVAQTLQADGYLETFRATDLRPGQARALVYSQAMRHPETNVPAAVLCLSFRFEHEMAAIFAAYGDRAGRANMLLLDAERRVISSADPLWIPAGVRVPAPPQQADGDAQNDGQQAHVLLFAGRAYLASIFASGGYQGYPGPAGWTSQVMVPLDLAFDSARAGSGGIDATEPRLLQGLLSHADSFNPALHALLSAVTAATHGIKRIVWNGKVTTSVEAHAGNGGNERHDKGDGGAARLGTILDQITETGQRSDAVFSRSIRDLYRTVLASSMRAAEFTSQLLVDMLDRSLYERANDCRWWALASQLRHGLLDADAARRAQAIGAVLKTINALYTVYSRLFVYDRSGVVIAATGSQDVVGARIDGGTLSSVCKLRDPGEHHVEPFAPSAFYGGRPTFIYHAAIRDPEREQAVVGGIGIVFDGATELANMLASGVAGRPGMHAFFCAPDGRVLCSTDPAIGAGTPLGLEPGLLDAAMEDGASVSRIVTWRGQYCVAACTAASGYREFRAGAHREEPVLAVLLQTFGLLRDDAALDAALEPARIESVPEGGRAVALFHAQGALMALDAACVVEAVPFARVKKAPGPDARIGMLDIDLPGQPRAFVWVFDLARLMGGRGAVATPHSQVLLVRKDGRAVGLLVDDVHSVQQFDASQSAPLGLAGGTRPLSKGLIKANGGAVLIQELDIGTIFAALLVSKEATV